MEWRATGIVLSVRRYGENAVIIEALTADYGRHAGLVRGGAGRRLSPVLQPGNHVSLRWRSRLSENLGAFEVELIHPYASDAISDREALATLDAMRALACVFLPQRTATSLFDLTELFLKLLTDTGSRRVAYAQWEIALLAELGFGLDLKKCAVTAATEGLSYVSPRSGRAVTRQAGAEYADKLLPLPPFLSEGGTIADAAEFADALVLSGYFLERWAGGALGLNALPPARERLLSIIKRQSKTP